MKLDWVRYEADLFSQTLDRTVCHIHLEASRLLRSALEQQTKDAEGWLLEETGISTGQYQEFLQSEWMVQLRALSIMSFALMETQLLGYVKNTGRFLDKHYPKKELHYGKKGEGEFLRLKAEYEKRYQIQWHILDGFETCREIILARNACIHEDCVPSKDYEQQTDCRFLGPDGLLILDEKSLALAVEGMKSFVLALAKATNRQIDAAQTLA